MHLVVLQMLTYAILQSDSSALHRVTLPLLAGIGRVNPLLLVPGSQPHMHPPLIVNTVTLRLK